MWNCNKGINFASFNPMERLSIVIGIVALTPIGCAHHVYSPPARSLPIETVATLEPGNTSLALETGVHGSVFGPDIFTSTGRARHTFTQNLEGVAEVNLMHLIDDAEAQTHPNIYGLRFGCKYRLTNFLAFPYGIGGGYSEAGFFISPDLGAILAYENPYIIPFLSVRGYVSQPIGKRAVDIGEDTEGEYIEKPDTTWGASGAIGGRVPVTSQSTDIGSILFGLGVTHMADAEDYKQFFGGTIGLELLL